MDEASDIILPFFVIDVVSSRGSRQREEIVTTPPKRSLEHGFSYYGICAMGGVLASTNRWVLTPLDVVKVNMQAHPRTFPTVGSTVQSLFRTHGPSVFVRGLGATAIGYGAQTGTKYGLYEVFKDILSKDEPKGIVPDAFANSSAKYVLAAGAAEVFGTVVLCPGEMAKVILQTNVLKAQQPVGSLEQQRGRLPSSRTIPALSHLWQHRHLYRFPFGSLGPLLGRQVPSTIANFLTFETTVDAIYRHVLGNPSSREVYSASTQLSVSLFAGFTAGVVSAIVSHPADSIVSRLSLSSAGRKPSNTLRQIHEIIQAVGWKRLATLGLVPRCVSVGTIVSLQWLVYDSFRTSMGLGTSGGWRAEQNVN